MELLLDTGKIDMEAKDVNHETALSLAIKKRHDGIIRLLYQTGKANSRKEAHGVVKRVHSLLKYEFKYETAGRAILPWERTKGR